MTLSELLGHLRVAVLSDDASPYLWQDAELVRYLNLAQDEFARRTHCFVDDSEAFTTFDTVDGQVSYDLDPRIIFVKELGLSLDNGNGDLSYRELPDRTSHQLRYSFSKGMPRAYNLQVATKTVRFYPTPDDAYTVRMLVARKPLSAMSQADDTPEIDEDFHINLCNYAAKMALMNLDPDGTNPKSAALFNAAWEVNIRDAKRYYTHMRAGPTPRARANWTGKRWGTYL